MSKVSAPERLFLDGPAGRLEALHEQPVDTPVLGCALVSHPHPLHGGTMNNKVTHTLARAFVRAGLAALRFNFRGTANSEGEYDDGIGELADALAAIDWLRSRHPEVPLWLGGFSFGAAIAVQAAATIAVDGLISVAPPVSRVASSLQSQPDCPWLVVHGDADEVVAVDESITWVNALRPGPELVIIPGATHFFHGRLIDLKEAAVTFIAATQA
jgi:alpha/beta superfamily hydrolase